MKKLNEKKLDELITAHAMEDMADGKLGGAEIIVNQEGERVFHKRFGKKSIESGEDLPAGTVYRLASMTKPVTAVAVLREVEAGRIDLWAPVSDYLPGFEHMVVAHPNEAGDALITDHAMTGVIRVWNLLSHTSGIGCGNVLVYLDNRQPKTTTLADVVNFYSKQPLAFDPATDQAYSPTAAFDVAARIVELTSGEGFADYLENHIFAPLGMVDTTFDPNEEQWERMIVMHGRDKDGHSIDLPDTRRPRCVFTNFAPSVTSAGAGLASTAEDYSKFAEMLCRGGIGANGTRIVSEEMIRKMRTFYTGDSIQDSDQHWGLGVRVITRPGYCHGLGMRCFGWSGAFGTHFWVDPDNKITAIYMKNCGYDGGAGCKTGNRFEEDVSAALE